MYADKQTLESMSRIVGYLYDDEAKHFEEAGKPERHIFKDVEVVSGWLKQQVVNHCANCGGKTKYPKYCTKYPCRQKAGTESMYNVARRRQ
jgi:hypothetical protein